MIHPAKFFSTAPKKKRVFSASHPSFMQKKRKEEASHGVSFFILSLPPSSFGFKFLRPHYPPPPPKTKIASTPNTEPLKFQESLLASGGGRYAGEQNLEFLLLLLPSFLPSPPPLGSASPNSHQFPRFSHIRGERKKRRNFSARLDRWSQIREDGKTYKMSMRGEKRKNNKASRPFLPVVRARVVYIPRQSFSFAACVLLPSSLTPFRYL